MSLSKKEEVELLRLLEAEEKENSLKSYDAFAQRNIKIVDKTGNQIPFKHNKIQQKINDTVQSMKAANKPVRIIILKARQEGVSTNEQGRMTYNTTTKPNRTGLIVAHEAPATAKIFDKARYMYNNMPEDVKPLTRASNARELIFDTPTGYKGNKKGLNSKISIQVAGDVGIGRGDTVYYAHLSEFAFWPAPEGKEPKKQLAGILQAIPKLPETEVVIESTANGYNDFKALWDDAEAGTNEWVPLFFAWHDHEEYKMSVTENERQKIMSGLNEYEQEVTRLYDLTAEQIKWYRWTLKNDCNNDINMMKQENPSYPEEAFIHSGTPVFNLDKIIHRKAELEKQYKVNPYIRGEFIVTWNNPDMMDFPVGFKWTDNPRGCISIYEDIKPGYPYVIGGDTKGEGSDKFAGTVINNHTGVRCATLHGEMKSKFYASQMWALGMYYNTALIGIETNFNTYPVELLTDWNYPRQYIRERKDTFTGEIKKAYGFRTDGNTRPLIIEKEITVVEEDIGLFNDIPTLDEMITFVENEKGRPDAESGKHDDLLFSDMIGNEIRGQQTRLIDEPESKEDYDEDDEEYRDAQEGFFD